MTASAVLAGSPQATVPGSARSLQHGLLAAEFPDGGVCVIGRGRTVTLPDVRLDDLDPAKHLATHFPGVFG